MDATVCPLCGLPAQPGPSTTEITGRQVHRVCELERRVGDLEAQVARFTSATVRYARG